MALFKKHCEDCMKKFGKDYADVHHWLDEFAKQYPPQKWGAYHRQFRHNIDGINEVRKMWGDEAAAAAEIHILEDMGFIQNWKKLPTPLDWE